MSVARELLGASALRLVLCLHVECLEDVLHLAWFHTHPLTDEFTAESFIDQRLQLLSIWLVLRVTADTSVQRNDF